METLATQANFSEAHLSKNKQTTKKQFNVDKILFLTKENGTVTHLKSAKFDFHTTAKPALERGQQF